MPDAPLIFCRAAALRDAREVNVRPGVVAVRDHMILAAGDETMVRRETGAPDRVIDLGDVLLMPGMVNAHVHLDLTHQPRVPYAGDFIDWLKGVIQSRVTDEHAITAAVQDGLRRSYESGVVAVADIAGSVAALRALLLSPLDLHMCGRVFLEVTGFGARGLEAAQAAHDLLRRFLVDDDEIHEHTNARGGIAFSMGLEPHAPYSAGHAAYHFATTSHWRSCTHLAETREEEQFVRDAAGPFAELLKRLGKWDDSIRPQGVSPVQSLRPFLESDPTYTPPWIVAHCNYVDDADIQTLAQTQTSVAYCPVASAYFRHQGHRYREMIETGVNVCLGTDSILCQPADEPQPLSILAQMRHLYRRDGTEPALLLRMATINGAEALKIPAWDGALDHGATPAFCVVPFDVDDPTDALVQVLRSRAPACAVWPSFAEANG